MPRHDLRDTIHRVWLAGLGALVAAEREGGSLFRDLVQKGEEVERDADSLYPMPSPRAWEVREPEAAWDIHGNEVSQLVFAERILPEVREEKQILAAAGLLLERIAEQRGQVRQMIDAMLPASVPSPVAVLQARRNAEARTALFEEFGGLTSAEVADLAGSRARNKAALANRWKQEGRLFSVPFQGGTYFPGFQLDAQGRPRPVIAEVIRAFGGKSSEWELALWFTTSTGWLGGRRPVDLLESHPEAVAEAARSEAADLFY